MNETGHVPGQSLQCPVCCCTGPGFAHSSPPFVGCKADLGAGSLVTGPSCVILDSHAAILLARAGRGSAGAQVSPGNGPAAAGQFLLGTSLWLGRPDSTHSGSGHLGLHFHHLGSTWANTGWRCEWMLVACYLEEGWVPQGYLRVTVTSPKIGSVLLTVKFGYCESSLYFKLL